MGTIISTVGRVIGTSIQLYLGVKHVTKASLYGLVMWLTVASMFFMYLHSGPSMQYVCCLTVAYAASSMIPSDFRFRDWDETNYTQVVVSLMGTIISTVLGVAILTVVDMSFSSRATNQARQRLLRALERFWSDPRPLGAYSATARRLEAESPLFQRLRLGKLPAVGGLVLRHLPPLTLAVTLQLHEGHLYCGAACSPPEGDPSQRAAQTRHLALRRRVPERELRGCLAELRELDPELERDLLAAAAPSERLEPPDGASPAARHAALLARADALVAEPTARALAARFWPQGVHLEHPLNPRHLLLLPDAALWDLPLERLPSVLALFGRAGHGCVSRDLSLHLAAQRVQRFVEAPEGEAVALRQTLPAVRPSATLLLTDPFDEDALRPAEDPRSETMCALHERLARDRVVGGEDQSLHGRARAASPEDIKGMLADSSAFYSLGFGRFLGAVGAGRFASQDLRHVALLALFQRSINDRSFRRQTKAGSARTPHELAAESAFGLALVAAFRGVACTVLATAPVPVPLSMRCLEAFAREVREGRTVARAVERSLGQTTPAAAPRLARMLEGGAPAAAHSGAVELR
mmetsp:Transcript_126625/g.394209  ORF Transcript_126625/g.394209 Transcript_126625/m.394209 type:complete len:581 (-) Transcript_126625:101-1843(-)